MSKEERIYRFSVKPDIHNLFYIGLFLLGLIVLPIFLIIGVISQMKILLFLGIFSIIIGVLFWKVEKKFIFSPKTGILTIETIRIKITWYSKTFLIKDCPNFDIQFNPRMNASFFVLQHNTKKPYRIQFKGKHDEINLHLVNLNQMLSSIKSTYFPSSLTEKSPNNNEEIIASDKKRKITRDVDHKIVISRNYFLFLLAIIPLLLVYASYLFFGAESSIGMSSKTMLLPVIMISLNYIVIVYFMFYTLRVKDLESERINEILSGNQLFTPPKFLQNFLNNLKVLYIKPEQVSFYRKLRKGLIFAGIIPIITSLVFFFLSFRN